MENKVDTIKRFLEEHIVELENYINDANYDECEKHDCRVAMEECEFILGYINSL